MSDSDEEESSPMAPSPDMESVDSAYYGFLNVSRTASQEEITAAYKKLARLYHPDKHQDPDKRAQAELLFAKLKRAYEVLSDPHQRAIYDCLGEKGLDEHTAGYLRYSTNYRLQETEDSFMFREEDSGMCTMIVRNTERYQTTASLQFGIPYTYAMLAHTWKFPEKKRKFRGALKVGTFGAILEYGVEEKITEHSSLGATMVVGTMGVICKLKLTRASQTYLFPFQLSDEVILQPVFYGTVVPLLAWLTVKKLLLEPMELKRKEEVKEKLRQSMREKVAAARQEAEASLSLMEERFRRGRSEEETKDGLVIEICLYGLLATKEGDLIAEVPGWGEGAGDISEAVDITKPVQCSVEHSRLVLWEGSKSSLPGVWDPCPGEDKWILIRYSYQGTRHQYFCPENDAVKLPKTAHRIIE